MKVLMVINSMHTGGAEKMVAAMLPLLQRDHIKIDLLLIDGSDAPFLTQLRNQFHGQIHVLAGNIYSPMHAIRLSRIFKRYDLIHVHLFPALYWAGLAKFFGGKYRLVFTEHSTDNKRRGNFALRMTDRMIYKQFDKIICITEEVKSLLQKHLRIDDAKFEIIHNGVDLASIYNASPYPRADFGLTDETFLLVQVSSFRYPKDQATVVRALKNLPERMVLLLVGEGPEIEAVKNLVTKLNLEHRVQFLGVRSDVLQILKTADAVILSSAYEGLSLSSLEGLASGKPFLASDVAGLHETVNGFGILFPLGDDKRLSDEIMKLASDTTYYEKTAQAGLLRAAEFDIETTVAEHIKLYRSLS